MRQLELEEIKSIQIKILIAFDRFCNEHNLKYSLSDGTLLGAVRHQGYIPWDDDIDVVMPRIDYDIFEHDFPELYEGHYKLASLNRDKKWNRVYANLYDASTLLIENDFGYNIGVNIDIFPLDDVPDDINKWEKFLMKLKFYYGLQSIKLIPVKKNLITLKNILLIIAKILICWIPDRKLAKKCEKIAIENNGKGYNSMYASCFGAYNSKPYPKKIFDEIRSLPFEGQSFKTFVDFDTYLKISYGNYMILPSVEQQITHHSFVAYSKS